MKNSKLLCGLMLLAGISISGSALADHWGHHGHVGVGIYIGGPYHPYYHPYYPYPYYGYGPYYPYYPYAPPAVVVQQPPATYVEQPQASVAPAVPTQAANSWYHCDKPDGYYPYIKECPGGWKAVTPSPPQP